MFRWLNIVIIILTPISLSVADDGISTKFENISRLMDVSYVGFFSGPSPFDPSFSSPLAKSKMNLSNYVKAGYRFIPGASIGALTTFTLSPDRTRLDTIGAVFSKWKLIKVSNFWTDIEVRFFYTASLSRFSGFQLYHGTTYVPNKLPITVFNLGFFHYNTINNALLAHTFPVLTYQLASWFQPAIFGRAAFSYWKSDIQSEYIMGPAGVFRPAKGMMIAPGIAFNLRQLQLNYSSFITVAQCQIF